MTITDPTPSTQHTPIDLTVAICTHNRAALLDLTLSSLYHADPADACRWEIVIVDNRSTDRTRAVVDEWRTRLPLRYVYEAESGLSAARNRAMAEAQSEWILFTDDDVVVDAGWLTATRDALRRWPQAGYIAGRILPIYDRALPEWWTPRCESLLAGVTVRYTPDLPEGPLPAGTPRPMGANLAFHLATLRSIGGFRTDLGRRGASLVGGEEVAVIRRIEEQGRSGVYAPLSLVHHRTPIERLCESALMRYFAGVGIAAVRTGDFPPASRLGPPRWVLPRILLSGLTYLKMRLSRPADEWIESVRTLGYYAGAAYELLRTAPHATDGSSEKPHPLLGYGA